MSFRIRGASWHLLGSLLVAALSAVLVFGVWYPAPYAAMSGGVTLFLLLTGVDVVVGPLLTLVVLSAGKTIRHLCVDMVVIVSLQMAAFAYGVHTVYIARPVVVAAENYLFRVVAANDVAADELSKARPAYRSLSSSGPILVGVRTSASGEERLAAIDMALKGYDVGARPSYWQPYELSQRVVAAQAKSLDEVSNASAEGAANIRHALQRLKRSAESVGYLHVMARNPGWVALVDRGSGEFLSYVFTGAIM